MRAEEENKGDRYMKREANTSVGGNMCSKNT